APCDLITVKLRGDITLDRILLPTAGGPHASLAAEFVSVYQKTYGSQVTCGYVVPEDAPESARARAAEWIEKTIHLTELEGHIEPRIIEGRRVASALAKTAGDFDLVVVGASKEGIFSSVLFGEIPEKVARYSRAPVMIVKRYEGAVKSVVKKIMG
ncbi:MAG: universal stress protein, partial [Candidatus Latescibacterota bacterium]